MPNAQEEERPFISGMEHQPEPIAATPGGHDVTVTILESWTRRIWRADGFIHRMLDSLSLLGDKVLSVAEQGPKDYEENSYERGMRDGARFGGYHEAPKPENNLKAVVIGCTCTLLSAFVVGAWKLSNDSAAIRAEFTEWKQSQTRWMDQIDRRLDRLESRRP